MHPGPGGPPTVLHVDDNADARESLSFLLGHHGFQVWEAGTAREAFALAARGPDLVLLDVHLPDGSGIDVCRRLKADPVTGGTPVLLLSGLAVAPTEQVAGLDGGADGYLTKPADPGLVVAHLRALLRVRRAEEALRDREALIRGVVANIPGGVFWKDRAGVFLGCNEKFARDNGRATPGEVVGRTDRDLGYPAEQLAAFAAADRRVLETGEPVFNVEAPLAQADGSAGTALVSKAPLRDAAGAVVGVLGVYQDVTEAKRLADQLRQAQKMEAVGRLAGGIAHEFNNLLTVINGYTDLWLNAPPSAADARPIVEAVHRAGGRAAELTRQLLAFGRKQILRPRDFDLNALVGDAALLLGRVLGGDVSVATDLAPGPLPVRADPAEVEQVVMNLALNARDAMPGGGRVTMRTRAEDVAGPGGWAADGDEVRPGRYARLSVSDTGHGMDDRALARVWEPFFTTKPVGKGTGLGLATVYGIVKAHGGHVRVESAPGKGSTFHVLLPATAAAAAPGPAPAPADAPGGSEAGLLVEDDAAVRAFAAAVLRGLGYAVEQAAGGEEAVAASARPGAAFDLLLTDVVMPGMAGSEVAARLTAVRPGLRVVFMSGHADDGAVRRGVTRAGAHFLPKPFTPAALAKKVREALDAPG